MASCVQVLKVPWHSQSYLIELDEGHLLTYYSYILGEGETLVVISAILQVLGIYGSGSDMKYYKISLISGSKEEWTCVFCLLLCVRLIAMLHRV